MRITQNKVVSMQVQISDVNGEILDSSEPDEDWCILIGSGTLPDGLEKAMEGQEVGAAITVTLTPAEGYGERDESKIQTVPRSDLDDDSDIEVGDQLEAETDDGWEFFTVLSMDADTITVDPNHELAGKTLKFELKISEVRDATPEELEHGHAHGDGCDDEVDDFDEDWDEDEDDAEEPFEDGIKA